MSKYFFRIVGMHFIIMVSIALSTARVRAQSGAEVKSEDVVRIINELRTNPESFIPEVDKYVEFWKSFVPNKKNLERAGEEAKARLLNQPVLVALKVDSGLVAASMAHVLDGEQMGTLGHIGSDNSNPATRAEKYGWYSSVSECITYNQTTASRVVAAFIVDENTPNRGHRESLLNPDFQLIGVSNGLHPKYDIQCVVMLGLQ